MMSDEAIATANIQNFCAARDGARDFQRHVISAAYFATATFARPATLDRRDENIEQLSEPSRALRLRRQTGDEFGHTLRSSATPVPGADTLENTTESRDGDRWRAISQSVACRKQRTVDLEVSTPTRRGSERVLVRDSAVLPGGFFAALRLCMKRAQDSQLLTWIGTRLPHRTGRSDN
jgi:hypothetical protein